MPTSPVAKPTSVAIPIPQAANTPNVSPPFCQVHLLIKILPKAKTATREIMANCHTNTSSPLPMPTAFHCHLQQLKSPLPQWLSRHKWHLLCHPRHQKPTSSVALCCPRHLKSPLLCGTYAAPGIPKSNTMVAKHATVAKTYATPGIPEVHFLCGTQASAPIATLRRPAPT